MKDVRNAKSNSGIFLKQLFKYNSLKVWLPSLGWRLKKDLNTIPVSFFVESNKSNNWKNPVK